MTQSPLETLLRRDRAIILVAILASAALAWAYIIRLSGRMMQTPDAGMAAMPGMASMPGMPTIAPQVQSWSNSDFFSALLMWAVMMIGMMLPAVAPTILLYARVGRTALQRPFSAASWFVAGYVAAWTSFSVMAALAQAGLSAVALLTPMLKSASDVMGGSVLVAAGIYQFSPLKKICLDKCQAPMLFIQQHGGFRPGIGHSLRLGFRHGLYCIGCCWALMLLLFVGGIMNIAWIAALSVLVLLEKLLRNGWIVARLAGDLAVATGLFLLWQSHAA